MPNENLGAAERIIQTLMSFNDHLVHNRPGLVTPNPKAVTGVSWVQAYWKTENGERVLYRKEGKKKATRVGVMQEDGRVPNVGRYMPAGLFTENAVWMYRQVAEVWKLDNEFAARWASHTYLKDDTEDRKLVLAAFMLVQSRKGDPVLEGDKVAFLDEDFRDVGEAMVLSEGKKYLNLKQILRIYDFLNLPEIIAINRELGFSTSQRNPCLGRWRKAAEKWLRYREENPKMLEGLKKAGFQHSVRRLAEILRYKPTSAKFYKIMQWRQDQSSEGHREFAIGEAVKAGESWKDLSEEQICERIVQQKPNLKRIVGLLPETGLTRAIMAAAIEAGSLSNKDLIIYTPTLEELGLLKVPAIHGRWQAAIKAAEDQRAANIASRVRSKETKEQLQEAADTAVQKAVEEVLRGMMVHIMIDISSSMEGAITKAKEYIAKFLPGFPLDKIHVSVFNTSGREVQIKHRSAAGVENAFRGISAGGGTSYGSGVTSLRNHRPGPEEDLLMIFIGDEDAPQSQAKEFSRAVRESGLSPVAFGLIPVVSPQYGRADCVRVTAAKLGIPCFEIDERVFEDAYAVPRMLRTLIAATPVGAAAAKAQTRETLVDTILKTGLLQKPAWAA